MENQHVSPHTIITDSGKIADVVRNFDGSPLGAIGLLQPSTDLQNAITDGTAKIQATDSLNLIDTLKLLPKINELSTATSESLDLLIEKKPLFDQAGVTAIVLDNLKKQQAGSAALQDAISSKLPWYIPQFIKDLAGQGPKQKLQEAVDKFSEPAAAAPAA